MGDRRRSDGAGELPHRAGRGAAPITASITSSRSIRREFVGTVAGASGSPFLDGNSLELLNNGDAFYPPMLAAIKERRTLDHDRSLHLLGRRDRRDVRRSARRARQAGCPVKILLDAIGSASIGSGDPRRARSGGCQVAWYNPIRWYTLGRFNNRTHRKSLIIDGDVAFTGGAGIADHWRGNASGSRRMARHADPSRGAGGRPVADRIRAQLATDDRRASVR